MDNPSYNPSADAATSQPLWRLPEYGGFAAAATAGERPQSNLNLAARRLEGRIAASVAGLGVACGPATGQSPSRA